MLPIISYLQLIPTSTIELCFKLSQMVWHFFKFLFDLYYATSLLWLFKKQTRIKKNRGTNIIDRCAFFHTRGIDLHPGDVQVKCQLYKTHSQTHAHALNIPFLKWQPNLHYTNSSILVSLPRRDSTPLL